MNSLSWFLYVADIIVNIQGLLIFAGIVALVLFAIKCISIGIDNNDNNKNLPYPSFKYLTIPLMLWLIAAAIPSQKTMYMILASEVSESVATTPEAKKIMQDVYEVVQKQLNKMKEGQ